MKQFYFLLAILLLNFSAKSQVYVYPSLPGSDEWKKFTSTTEKINACQLPDDYLSEASTKDLLTTCLNYPLLYHYTASNSYKQGLDNIIQGFNGLRAFLTRKDCGIELFNYYQKQNINDIKLSKDPGAYTFYICALELLFAREEVISKYNIEQRQALLEKLKSNYLIKQTYQSDFGYLGSLTTAYVGINYKTYHQPSIKIPFPNHFQRENDPL